MRQLEVTPTQAEILAVLTAALEDADEPQAVFRIEWWGYIPDPVAQYLEVDGTDIGLPFPRGWGQRDLDALARAGFLHKVDEWQNPDDEYDRWVAYEAVGQG